LEINLSKTNIRNENLNIFVQQRNEPDEIEMILLIIKTDVGIIKIDI